MLIEARPTVGINLLEHDGLKGPVLITRRMGNPEISLLSDFC